MPGLTTKCQENECIAYVDPKCRKQYCLSDGHLNNREAFDELSEGCQRKRCIQPEARNCGCVVHISHHCCVLANAGCLQGNN